MNCRITVAAASVALVALAACSRGDNNAYDSAGGTAGAMATPPATTPAPSNAVGGTTGATTSVGLTMGAPTSIKMDTTGVKVKSKTTKTKSTKRPY